MAISSPARRREYGRWAIVIVPGVLALVIVMLRYGPIPQDPSYHDFADRRVWFGIPHAGDVLSNLLLLAVGLLGLARIARATWVERAFEYADERWIYGVFFAGIAFTGVGSMIYHWQPDNASLVWDRLPIIVTLMALLCAVVAERIGPRIGLALLAPLVAVGVTSVAWWAWSEQQGYGDLRLYALLVIDAPLALALLLVLWKSRYTHGGAYWWVLGWYGAAKACEALDAPIFHLSGGVVSGHNLKHLAAAVSAGWVLGMLSRRALAAPV
ncbi:MAG: alkaline phytoceramidase [Gammaproteobacteria bacterium]